MSVNAILQGQSYTRPEVDTLLDTKQDTLTFDTSPSDSNNPVTSSGIKAALEDQAFRRTDVGGKDLNTIKTPGLYYWTSTLPSANAPSSSQYAWMLVLSRPDINLYVNQYVRYGGRASHIYERHIISYNPETWSEWKSKSLFETTSIENGGTGATTAADALAALGGVPTSRTINNKALTGNISLNANDVGARANNWLPTPANIGAEPAITTLPVSKGGTGMTTATAKNAVVIGNGSNAANAFQTVATASGAFYAIASNGKPQFGTLPAAQGGTGLTASPSMLTNLGSTTAANVFLASPRPGVTGTLPVANGGTGLTASPSMIVDLTSTSAVNVLASSPTPGVSGTLPVAHGGTGFVTASYKNAVVIGNSTTVTNSLQTVRTGNGAFYATAPDAKPSFGTLPVAQGGTGATTIDGIKSALEAAGYQYALASNQETQFRCTTLANHCCLILIYARAGSANMGAPWVIALSFTNKGSASSPNWAVDYEQLTRANKALSIDVTSTSGTITGYRITLPTYAASSVTYTRCNIVVYSQWALTVGLL